MSFLLALLLIGGWLWLNRKFLPMTSNIQSVLNVVVAVAVGTWALPG
jgi:hypothetical protein